MAKKKKSNSGVGGAFKNALALLLAASVVFAFVKGNNVRSPSDVMGVFQGHAPSVGEFFDNLVGNGVFTWPDADSPRPTPPSGGNSGGGSGGSSGNNNIPEGSGVYHSWSPTEASNALENLVVVDQLPSVDYDRSEWRHWDNITSCWTVRDEVLHRQAEPDSLTLLDNNDNPTDSVENACTISGGEWVDPFTGDIFTNPSDLDIDHMIPLGYAARAGGQQWDEDTKRDYANSLEEGHLLAVSASANRSKGDKGPANWQPRDSYQCEYAKHWVSISDSWNLEVPQEDYDALTGMLATC